MVPKLKTYFAINTSNIPKQNGGCGQKRMNVCDILKKIETGEIGTGALRGLNLIEF